MMKNSLPDGWIETTLESLVSKKGVFSDGDWVESKDQDPSGDVRLTQLADIGDMHFINKSNRYMTSKKADAMKCLYLEKDDLLISRLGDPLGKACLYPANESKAVTVVDVCVFRPGHSYIDVKLIGYFLNSMFMRGLIDEQASGTTRKRITGKKIKALPFRLPPLNEQKRIVERIEQLFSDLDKSEALLKTVQKQLSTYRQSVLNAAVTGELTKDWREKNKKKPESGEKLLARILESRRENWRGRGQYKEATSANLEGMPKIPEGWVWCSLGQLTSFITSGSRGWAEHYSESGAYFFRSQNVTEDGLSMEDIAYVNPPQNSEGERTKLYTDDLLISITGNPGNVAAIPELDAEAYISQHVCLARPVDVKTASYLGIIIRSWPIKKYFERVQYGLTKPGLNLTQIAECPIPLPSKAEQAEIILLIEDVFSKIDVCESLCVAELNKSKILRQSILKSAFSGKLVAQDPADEPASELLARIKLSIADKTKTPAKIKSKKAKKAA